jgi:hypothetical protein
MIHVDLKKKVPYCKAHGLFIDDLQIKNMVIEWVLKRELHELSKKK